MFIVIRSILHVKVFNYKKTIVISIICFAISSFSFTLIPFSNFRGSKSEMLRAYMVGVFFWSGLLTGLVLTFLLSAVRKKAAPNERGRPGIISFFKNPKAKYCDIAMIMLIALWLILSLILGTRHMMSMMLMSLSVFSIYLHAILNGKNYKFACRKGVRK